MADQRIMRRFRSGDPDAVRQLYARYGRAVFTVAYRSLGDHAMADEVVQETFLKAWRAAARFEEGRDPGPWLYAIARRAAVDMYRRERRHSHERDDQTEMVALPPSFEGAWEAWEVRSALDQLTHDERTVIELTHYLGHTQSEAAEELGVPVGTVKSRSHRAHKRLAGLLSHVREVAI
jgi:RNA polymerase sigma-70 factor (ECF subfamily)